MPDDIVTELAQRCAGQGRTRELIKEAADEIERLHMELAAAQAQTFLWREIAIEAQDKVDALQLKVYEMELRCDCS